MARVITRHPQNKLKATVMLSAAVIHYRMDVIFQQMTLVTVTGSYFAAIINTPPMTVCVQ